MELVESTTVINFPRPDAALDPDTAGAPALAEIDAAIALVAAGAARRVRLTAIPFVESVAQIWKSSFGTPSTSPLLPAPRSFRVSYQETATSPLV